MREKGNILRSGIVLMTNNFETVKPLDPQKVERGEVYVQELEHDEFHSSSILFVAPNSKVREHEHMDDEETYTVCNHSIFREVKKEDCPKGGRHFLENTSPNMWLMVRSDKRKV